MSDDKETYVRRIVREIEEAWRLLKRRPRMFLLVITVVAISTLIGMLPKTDSVGIIPSQRRSLYPRRPQKAPFRLLYSVR